MSQGWIKLHRCMFDSELWLSEPFSKAQAWIDLIGNANHKPKALWIRGSKITVGRGELAWSKLTMSKRWQWSREKVNRYLRALESESMIRQQTSQLTTLITICKYDEYQQNQKDIETTDETPNESSDETTNESSDESQTRSKELKNGKNKDKNSRASALPAVSEPKQQMDYSSWPEEPDPQILKDWIASRKKAKATHSQTAINRIGTQLHRAKEMGFSVNECLAECVTRGWKGFNPEWMQSKGGNLQQFKTAQEKRSERNAEIFDYDKATNW